MKNFALNIICYLTEDDQPPEEAPPPPPAAPLPEESDNDEKEEASNSKIEASLNYGMVDLKPINEYLKKKDLYQTT